MADAVITRDGILDPAQIWPPWKERAEAWLSRNVFFPNAVVFDAGKWGRARRQSVGEAREISEDSLTPIAHAYGGHYYSPKQALIFDALRVTLPNNDCERKVALAALICAASQCAASPGHTAQPFQPTKNAAEFLFDAWRRDVWEHAEGALENICPKHAKVSGKAVVSDAQTLAEQLCSDDLAFIDPPYTRVHNSRFKHVLETIARGNCDIVEGVGRYPVPSERPKSDYSVKSKSGAALDTLFSTLAERKVRTIVTFPKEETSWNGLSGSIVQETAQKYFDVSTKIVNGRLQHDGRQSQKSKSPHSCLRNNPHAVPSG